MDEVLFQRMQELCKSAGFTKKGKAFFRVLGDGVLQVIKCRYERAFRADLVCIGLQSMYAPLQPKAFTATGCTVSYPIAICYHSNGFPTLFAPSMEEQLDMLKNGVIPWLGTIDTQKKLVTAISKLDGRWNDSAKIGPFLACGEHNHAKKVIKEIIGAHSYAMVRSTRPRDASVEDMVAKVRKENPPYYGIIEIIDMGEAAIAAYLQANYEANMCYAKFCQRKKNEPMFGVKDGT